jgi:phospholipid-binding lipoprotein MlaA
MLQGELTRGGQTAGRFLINTTIGFGGFLDPASHMKIPDHGEDFGQTLAVWGTGEGPFLMLPFLGPSNPRDAFGLAADVGLDPTTYIHFKQHIWWDPAQFRRLLCQPAEPVPPAARERDPQRPRPQSGRSS